MRRLLYIFILSTLFIFVFFFPTFADETEYVTVSAVVPPIADLVNILTPQTTSTLYPGDITEYQIEYGNTSSGNGNYTLTAVWSYGTPEGGGSSTSVVDYVPNSATAGYAGAVPVLDMANRKLTWNLNALPGGTTRKVYFRLVGKSVNTGTVKINYSVNSEFKLGSAVVTSQSSGSYKQFSSSNSIPTPTKTPTPTPESLTPTPTISITPTPGTRQFTITGISASSILSTGAKINISTNLPSGAVLYLGTSPSNLSQKQVDPTLSKSHSFSISSLSPSTTYYAQVKTINSTGIAKTSDVITFKTAAASIAPEVDLSSVVLSSNNNVLLNNLSGASNSATTNSSKTSTNQSVVVIPVSKSYEFTFSLQGRQSAKKIRAVLKTKVGKPKSTPEGMDVKKIMSFLGVSGEKAVLGLATEADASSEVNNVEIIEIQPGIYKARLLGQPEPGVYELFVEIEDENGNLQEQKIAEIKVTRPFTILDSASKEPLEGVKVKLYVYNPAKKSYIFLSPGTSVFENPLYSNRDGSIDIVLPAGKYKAELSNVSYNAKNVVFTVKQTADSDYPQVYLKYAGFSLTNQIQYYFDSFIDFTTNLNHMIVSTFSTQRFFALSNLVVVLLFLIVLLHYISQSTHKPVYALPIYGFFRVINMLKNRKVVSTKLRGKVIDHDSKSPISGSEVFLIDSQNKVVSRTVTNNSGEFAFNIAEGESYYFQILRQNYKEYEISQADIKAKNGVYTFALEKKEHVKLISGSRRVAKRMFSLTFGAVLLFSVLFQLCLFFEYSYIKVLPYLTFSIITLLIWSHYLTTRKRAL